MIAVKNIDEVVKIIKTSSRVDEARQRLRDRFKLSERQAQAILDMRLARLTSIEIYKLEEELAETKKLIKELEAILASVKAQMEVVKSELLVIKRNFKDSRRSVILDDPEDYVIPIGGDEKRIEASVAVLSAAQTFKRVGMRGYNAAVKEFSDKCQAAEIPREVLMCTTSHTLYCFTNLGNCFKLAVDTIPEARWRDKGAKASELIPGLAKGEIVVKCFVVTDNLPKGRLLFYTRDGMIKLSDWSEYDVVKESFLAVKLKDA
jgi:DNA gyrase subunit A